VAEEVKETGIRLWRERGRGGKSKEPCRVRRAECAGASVLVLVLMLMLMPETPQARRCTDVSARPCIFVVLR